MLVPVVLVAALLAADVYSLAPAPKNMNGEYLTSQSTNLFGKQTFNTDFASKGARVFRRLLPRNQQYLWNGVLDADEGRESAFEHKGKVRRESDCNYRL